jgi:hypothetical protein
MKDSLYRACMAQLQMMLAAREKTPELPPIGPEAPNYALMMRVKR